MNDGKADSSNNPNNNASSSATRASIAELKGGKAVLHQKARVWSKGNDALAALMALNKHLEGLQEPLLSLPDEFLPLVAKLVHESDQTLSKLAARVVKDLVDEGDADDEDNSAPSQTLLPNLTIENAINRVATRRNYGIEDGPAALCLWRFEVNDISMLSEKDRDLAAKRTSERVQGQQELTAKFNALPEADRDALLPKRAKKKLAEGEVKSASTAAQEIPKDRRSSVPNGQPEASTSKTPDAKAKKSTIKVSTATKKNTSKTTAKSEGPLAKFFGTAQPKSKLAPKPVLSSKTDYESSFLRFAPKANLTIAPWNRLLSRKRRQVIDVDEEAKRSQRGSSTTKREVIEIDDDDDEDDKVNQEVMDIDAAELVNTDIDPSTILKTFISSVPRQYRVRSSAYIVPSETPSSSAKLKSYSPISVQRLIHRLTEAEQAGDEIGTKKTLELLKDRTIVRPKLLQFHENYRPPYFGTWTKSSTFVGPRTPFAKDLVVFDYSYDSGDDWAEEDVEGAEELLSDGESDGSGLDDFEEDDWLVDDDEAEAETGSVRSRSRSASVSAGRGRSRSKSSSPVIKRKAEGGGDEVKKRKKVDPKGRFKVLVPLNVGPHKESTIGERVPDEFKLLRPFQIQLLNDSHFGLDPFTFQSTCLEDYAASQSTSKGAHTNSEAGPSGSRISDFALPALPPHVLAQKEPNSSSSPASPDVEMLDFSNATSANNSSPAAPKKVVNFTLPAAYFPSFLRAIQGSDKTKPILVDELYKHFKSLAGVTGLRKGAVEGKLAEVAYKEKKIWKVKEDIWAAAGLPPL